LDETTDVHDLRRRVVVEREAIATRLGALSDPYKAAGAALLLQRVVSEPEGPVAEDDRLLNEGIRALWDFASGSPGSQEEREDLEVAIVERLRDGSASAALVGLAEALGALNGSGGWDGGLSLVTEYSLIEWMNRLHDADLHASPQTPNQILLNRFAALTTSSGERERRYQACVAQALEVMATAQRPPVGKDVIPVVERAFAESGASGSAALPETS
jgi:hypothetical protein